MGTYIRIPEIIHMKSIKFVRFGVGMGYYIMIFYICCNEIRFIVNYKPVLNRKKWINLHDDVNNYAIECLQKNDFSIADIFPLCNTEQYYFCLVKFILLLYQLALLNICNYFFVYDSV